MVQPEAMQTCVVLPTMQCKLATYQKAINMPAQIGWMSFGSLVKSKIQNSGENWGKKRCGMHRKSKRGIKSVIFANNRSGKFHLIIFNSNLTNEISDYFMCKNHLTFGCMQNFPHLFDNFFFSKNVLKKLISTQTHSNGILMDPDDVPVRRNIDTTPLLILIIYIVGTHINDLEIQRFWSKFKVRNICL